MLTNILLIGTGLWAVAEGLEFGGGGFSNFSNSVAVAAFAGIAIGIWALWWATGQNTLGRTGVVLLSLGSAQSALMAFRTIGSAIASSAEQSISLPSIAAAATMITGALALSYWLISISPFPLAAGFILLIATAFNLGVTFVPGLAELQPLSNLALAGTFFWLGWLTRYGR